MASTNWPELTTAADGNRVWWCRCVECLITAALLAVTAFLIGFATNPAVSGPAELVGFERYLFIWLVLNLFALTILAMTTMSTERHPDRQ